MKGHTMSSRLLQPTTDIFNHTNDLKKAATTVAGDLHDEAANHLAGLKNVANTRLSGVRGRAVDSWQSMTGFVRQHPFAAAGVGLFAGLILAAAVISRRD
jgi:ElaB/YqjD/DUF883 family membrane-anchored ribosome-binding protein